MSNQQNEYDQTEIKLYPILVSLLISSLILGVIYIATVYFYKSEVSKQKNKSENQNLNYDLVKLRMYESKKLNALEWINRDQKTAKIPIDAAMLITIKKYK